MDNKKEVNFILNETKKRHNFITETQLSDFLKTSTQNLSNMRKRGIKRIEAFEKFKQLCELPPSASAGRPISHQKPETEPTPDQRPASILGAANAPDLGPAPRNEREARIAAEVRADTNLKNYLHMVDRLGRALERCEELASMVNPALPGPSGLEREKNVPTGEPRRTR